MLSIGREGLRRRQLPLAFALGGCGWGMGVPHLLWESHMGGLEGGPCVLGPLTIGVGSLGFG